MHAYNNHAQQGKSGRFYPSLMKIKSRRLLKVGEPALIRDSTVPSDAMQACLMRKLPAFSKLGRMDACLSQSRASKVKAIAFMHT